MNNRAKQKKKYSDEQEFFLDRFQLISSAVFRRLTDQSRTTPPTKNILAMQIVQDNPKELTCMTAEEKNFFRKCLDCVEGGEELTEEEFFERATLQ